MPITLVARNGPPEAMTCPAILCDACGTPLTDTDHALVLWHGDWQSPKTVET